MRNLNWKDKSDYSYVEYLSGEELAWEFLRRNPEYQKEYKRIRKVYADVEAELGEFPHNEEKWRDDPRVVIDFPLTDHGDTVGTWNGRIWDKNAVPRWIFLEESVAGHWGLKNKLHNPEDDSPPEFRYAYNHPKHLTNVEVDAYLIPQPPFPREEIMGQDFIALGFDLRLPLEKQLAKAKDILKTQRDYRAIIKDGPSGTKKHVLVTYLRLLDATENKKNLHCDALEEVATHIFGHHPSDPSIVDFSDGIPARIERAQEMTKPNGYIGLLRNNRSNP